MAANELTELVVMPGNDYQAICNSVRSKTGKTELLKSGDIAPAIDQIEVGNNIDTSDATATANDIAYGKTAYSKDGKVTGEIHVVEKNHGYTLNSQSTGFYSNSEPKLTMLATMDSKKIWDLGSIVEIEAQASILGKATASDVLEGVTFTSENGLKLTGNFIPFPFLKTYKTGSFTRTSDRAGTEGIYHGWYVKPNFFCIYCKDSESLDSNYLHLAMGIQMTGSGQVFLRYMDQANSIVTVESTFFTSTTYFNLQDLTVKYKANATYNWIVGVI